MHLKATRSDPRAILEINLEELILSDFPKCSELINFDAFRHAYPELFRDPGDVMEGEPCEEGVRVFPAPLA